jgi:hypothetical protein
MEAQSYLWQSVHGLPCFSKSNTTIQFDPSRVFGIRWIQSVSSLECNRPMNDWEGLSKRKKLGKKILAIEIEIIKSSLGKSLIELLLDVLWSESIAP